MNNNKFPLPFATIQVIAPWVVAFITFLIFYSTMAPTVSFWDCGEYVSTAYTLGINHPPGNPLYVLAGRIFTMLFFGMEQIAARVNLFSVVSGALTAFFVYKIIADVVGETIGLPDALWKKMTIITSGVAGAFFSVLNHTYWFSAVEASAYAPSLLMLVISFYLVLRWSRSRDENRDRFLICAIYFSFLGIGFHLFSILALPPIFLYVIVSDQGKRKDICFWLSVFVLSSVAFAASTFIYVSLVLLIICGVFLFGGKTLAFTVNLIIATAALFLSVKSMGFSPVSTGPFVALLLMIPVEFFFSGNGDSRKKRWKFMFLLSLFALIGFSVYLSIPMRSGLHPAMDHGHPAVKWKQGRVDATSFGEFLDRSEYIPESMISRMLHRRGSFSSQFGFDDRIGYLGFHLTQFFHFGDRISQDRSSTSDNNMLGGPLSKRLLYISFYFFPAILMVWGICFWARADKEKTLLLVSMFLLASFGMVFYLNFSDGTRLSKQDQVLWEQGGKEALAGGSKAAAKFPFIKREVRSRDYFFTGAFVFTGIWIGLAVAAVLYKMAGSKTAHIRKLGIVCSYLFLLLPLVPFFSNYEENDRSCNWRTYDYAYNMLMSCEKGGILFVDGDDMFPLWFLQEVEGLRKDVNVISFALLKKRWYVSQLKSRKPSVPMSLSISDIDRGVIAFPNQRAGETEFLLPKSKIAVTVPGRNDKKQLLVQDRLLLDIVDETGFARPIYFPLNVSAEYLMGLWKYLKMEGMVYRLTRQPVKRRSGMNIDMERSRYLLTNVFKYRNLDEKSARFSETDRVLDRYLAAPFILYARAYDSRVRGARNAMGQYQAILDEHRLSNTKMIEDEIESLNRYINEGVFEIDNMFKRCLSLMPGNMEARDAYGMFLREYGFMDSGSRNIEKGGASDKGSTGNLHK